MKKIFFAIAHIGIFFSTIDAVEAAILFQDNFDGWNNFTVQQGLTGSQNCYENCSMGGNWTAYNTYMTLCGSGITNRPGYNSIYINSFSGYPLSVETCRGGTGKCFTKWQEACLEPLYNFDDADANLGVDLGDEHDDIHLRFYIRFPAGFVMNDNQAFKLFHVQHYAGGGSSPWNYFGQDTNNQPVTAGGIRRADVNYVDIYAEARGYPTYYTHNSMFWRMGTYAWATAEGGILDGDWHAIEIRQKINSSVGASDGLMETWFDGEKLGNWIDYPTDSIDYVNIASASRTDISFDAATKTITSVDGNLSNQVFVTELPLVVSGSTSNNGIYTIVSHPTSHQVTVAENLTNEGAGGNVTLTQTPSELKGFRFASVAGNNMPWTDACSDGSGDMAECEQWYAIDDVVVADQYIGLEDPVVDSTAPAAPAGLVVH